MSRSLRNRSSRYSSPATFGEKETLHKSAATRAREDVQATGFRDWIEPPVRNAVPSFEDTKGLERLGVLEHMAPLGVPPSSKLLQKLKVNLSRSSPRMTPVHTDDVEIPIVEATKVEIASPIDAEFLPEPVQIHEAKLISSPPRGRPAKKDVEEMRIAVDPSPSTPSPSKASGHQSLSSPKPPSIQDFIRQDRVKSSIKGAIEKAGKQDRKIIPGLELILEDAHSDSSLWSVLDAIVNKSPTNAQFKVFKRYIKRGIRQYRDSASLTASPSRSNVGQNHASTWSLEPNQSLRMLQSGDQSRARPRPESESLISPRQTRRPQPTVKQSALHAHDPFILPDPTQEMGSSAASGEHDQQGSFSSPEGERSRSASTTSSLSSAKSLPDDYPREIDENGEMQVIEGRPVRLSGQRQAINGAVALTRTRSTGTHQLEPSHLYSGLPTTIKFVSKKLPKFRQKEETPLESQEIEEKRRRFLKESFLDYNLIPRPESTERSVTHGLSVYEDVPSTQRLLPVIHPRPLRPSTATLLSSNLGQPDPEFVIINGTSRKRTYDEMDKDDARTSTPLSSSPSPSLAPPPPAHARGSTPRAGRILPANKIRKSARVMISPNKPKNGGITAGIPRGGSGRDTGASARAESGGEDNDEFCASCGGEGTLLCCDGCTNSFHHACLEPPLDPDDDVEGEWYCLQCIAKRNKNPLPTTGLMARVIRRVDDTIPKAYSLPFEIRDYFEGVKTGDEGEYEEISLPRTQNNAQKMNRAGFFEQPNFKELRDSKGNFITCYKCGKTSNGRDIVPCDFCPAKWHTDCVDPPMAVPPRRTGGDKPNGYWRCPLHVEQDLASISRQAESMPDGFGRLPRLRRPKGAIPIDIDMNRGFRNNGVIEVDLMKDEMPDIKEVSLEGGIYRIPEKGIRLDFIDRVKRSWYEDHAIPNQIGVTARPRGRLYRPGNSILHHPAAYTVIKTKEPDFTRGAQALAIAETAKANARLRQKSFVEQSAILSLIGMADQGQDQVRIDPLNDLVNQLIADAPEEVEQEIKSSERDSLLKLRELIQQRLLVLEHDDFSAAQAVPTGQSSKCHETKSGAEPEVIKDVQRSSDNKMHNSGSRKMPRQSFEQNEMDLS